MSIARIMIVEDEKIIAADIRRSLENMGYAVCAETSSGEEAILKSVELRPDVILMDIVLKGDMDGISAAEQIKHRIPVVFLTACNDETILQQAGITEFYGYIIKPFEDRELHLAIEIALYRNQMYARMKNVEQRLSTIIERNGSVIIDSDIEGRVTFMNQVAEELTGWKSEDAFGKMLAEIFYIRDEALSDLDKQWMERVMQESFGKSSHYRQRSVRNPGVKKVIEAPYDKA